MWIRIDTKFLSDGLSDGLRFLTKVKLCESEIFLRHHVRQGTDVSD